MHRKALNKTTQHIVGGRFISFVLGFREWLSMRWINHMTFYALYISCNDFKTEIKGQQSVRNHLNEDKAQS